MEKASLKWGIPHIEKIHEAYSAIADGRVKIENGIAKVTSSDYKKEYTISWEDGVYSSNDNASYWKGSLGYPVIAVLMLQGILIYSNEIALYFKGIKWKELNTKHKNNYAVVVDLIMVELQEKGITISEINEEVLLIFEQIKSLTIGRKRGSLRPPIVK